MSDGDWRVRQRDIVARTAADARLECWPLGDPAAFRYDGGTPAFGAPTLASLCAAHARLLLLLLLLLVVVVAALAVVAVWRLRGARANARKDL